MNRRVHTRQHSRRQSSIWVAFVILAMLASSLMALSSPAAAQPTETPPAEDVPLDPTPDPAAQPTEPPIVQPTEAPVIEPTEDPVALPPEGQPDTAPQTTQVDDSGSLVLRYRVCPPGTDLTATDPAALAGSCTEQQAGVTFDLRSNTFNVQLGVQNTGDAGPSGELVFDDLLVGSVTLTRVADPVDSMAVFCQGNTPQGNTKPYARYSLAPVQQWQGTSFDIVSEEQVACDWYVAEAAEGDITVIIRKYACPVGFAYDAADPDIYDFALNCQDSPGAVNFSVFEAGGGGYDGGVKPTSGGAQGGITNSVEFDDVANVPLWIYEELPAGYGDPVAFCGVDDFLGQDVLPSRYYPWNAGKIELDAPGEENVVQCDWYNILSGGDNSVTVYKWDCVPGTDHGQTMGYYQGEGQDEGPCEIEHLNIPITLIDGNGPRATTTQANGTQWDDVVLDQNGAFQIVEEIPAGYGDPMVFCGTLDDDEQQPVTAANGTITIQPAMSSFTYQCNWYNIPYQDSTVTIRKWECPQGATIEPTRDAYAAACTQPMDGVTFDLTDSKGLRSMVTAGGQAQWTDVAEGAVTITEAVPPGYHPQPFVVCGWTATSGGAVIDAFPQPVEATNGVLHTSIQYSATNYFCDWYNTYAGPGEVTINKWTCPEGYDPFAWNADPKNDCTELTNGVTFILDQPVGVDLQTDTGDSINGAVYFGGLEPGAYTVTEIVPDGIAMVFVYDCVGLNTGAVHPMPLSVGPTLAMSIAGGDEIVCDWMNVPAYDPDFGWMTVYKYICWTPSYVSDVDCEVFEDGKAFDLEIWNGANWVGVVSGTTNAAGQLTWINLDAGTYRLTEDNGTPCRIESNMLDGDGNLVVQQNAGTIVKVYNCSTTPPVPGGKMPTKYPNTGVEPVGTSDDAGSLFAVAGLLGAGSLSRRQFLRRAAAPTLAVGAGSLLFGTGIARQTIVPIELPGAAIGTPGADCLFPATPVATPGAAPSADSTPVACARGAVPMRVAIGEIEVDAEIEILETIGGEMQAPTGAVDVAWYKESARLGETGNILLAGHLNYWGVPEGVFFRLEALSEGDAVELEGDDGETYRYIVEWAENFPSDEEPPEETLGHTDNQSLTLITCGGEWSAEIAEYDHRTVVRAVRDVEPVG
ncbi:hypothetical protein BH23CHL3_BH23CHL3_06970 [soil metagenome]